MRSALDDDDVDYFELFCAQAGRRLSSASTYGGSLPSLSSRGKPSSVEAGDKPPNTLCLHVPEWPQIRRSRSDGGDEREMLCATSPKARHKPWPLKLLSSITCLSDSCDSHDLSPPPIVTICRSAPHSRSSSVKRRRRPRLADTHYGVDGMRPRTSSMPTRNSLQKPGSRPRPSPDDADEWDRVRNFVTTAKGVVNCGDSFRNKSCSCIQSLYDCDSSRQTPSSGARVVDPLRLTDERVPRQRVLLLGAAGVGKSTIAQQFLTSVCLVNGSEDSSVSGRTHISH
ncbi:hypothetical protein NP493_119g00028 [Ridgeia piscesae]|uniref:Uncharacterized protein n=1 Tax=Ridgeia piscesae TaxID=27915 RepID=A0AAD9UGV6_RIDPI|nr:hypothetical protein NP493_119g00028 [Ridgeia piscesae]